MNESKTPKFDALINKILNELNPHTRFCIDCKKEFKIEEEDVFFLKMFRSPAPKLCPECRHRNRLAFSNYSNIYKRKCSVPGHNDIMISPIAPIMPWVTYDYETYYSDKWDPTSFGRDIKYQESFFDQYLDLLKIIPQPGVRRGTNSVNSDFCFYGDDLKNGYYVFGGRRSENVLFSTAIYDSKNIIDCYHVRQTENAYGSVSIAECYKTKYTYFSLNCIESDFMHDCRNCQNCFGCVNLRNKNYCWFNEQLSREEYFKKRKKIDLGNIHTKKEYENKFWDFVKKNPIRAVRVFQSQNSSGNEIKYSKNCTNSFQAENCENVRFGFFVVFRVKNSMDVGFSGRSEKDYHTQNVSNSFNVKFSYAVRDSTDCEYLTLCNNCQNCFGCVGIKNGSYMIFNKKYESGEYFKAIDEIKTKMLEEGTYGEFFPMSFAPCAYNSSFANIMYPMNEEEAKSRGLFWQPDIDVDTKDLKTININELPDNISEVDYNICDFAIIGAESKKPFRLTQREIDFYKQNQIPLPVEAPYDRMLNRFKLLNNFKVIKERCSACDKEIESIYSKNDGYRPYCEECYKKEIL